MIIYGITTCSTCKAALKALQAAGYPATLRDVRSTPLSADEIAAIIAEFGESSVNKSAPSYRNMDAALKEAPLHQQLTAQPVAMKRPAIEHAGKWSLGWNASAQAIWLPKAP